MVKVPSGTAVSSEAGLGRICFPAHCGCWSWSLSLFLAAPLEEALCSPNPQASPLGSSQRYSLLLFKTSRESLSKNGLTMLHCISPYEKSHISILSAVFKHIHTHPSSLLCLLLRNKSQFLLLGRAVTLGSLRQDVGTQG